MLSEAEVEDNVCDDMSVVSEERESNREFIDDAEYDESVENYRSLDLIFLKKLLIIVLIMRLKK